MAIALVMLRIVSKASSVQEFVQLFSRLCDKDSIYVVTGDTPEVGLRARFTLTLADGQSVLSGTGEVAEVNKDKDNRHGHPGMKLRFGQLDPACIPVLERLAAFTPTRGSGLNLIGGLNKGSIEPIVQCAVHEEPDDAKSIARPQTPAPTSAGQRRGIEEADDMDAPPTQRMPGLPDAAHAMAASIPTERVTALSAGPLPPPAPPAPPAMPRAVSAITPQPELPRPATPFPSAHTPPPVAAPVSMAAAPVSMAAAPVSMAAAPVSMAAAPMDMAASPFARPTRRNSGHIELTEVVRPLRRPINRAAIIASALIVVVVGIIGSYLLWGRSTSSPATAGMDDTSSGRDAGANPANDGPDSTDISTKDCKVVLDSKPDGATVHARGSELGTTPLETTLPCGQVTFEFTRSRYLTLSQEVELAPGHDNKVEVELGRPSAELEIVSIPPDATVLIDGKNAGKTPLTVTVDAYSRTTIVVRKSRYQVFRKQVFPKPPKYKVEAKLRKRR
jgi:hypothetical protein